MMMSLIRSMKEHGKLVEKLVEIEQESALRTWASRMLQQSCKLLGRRESYEAARSQCELVTTTPVDRNKKQLKEMLTRSTCFRMEFSVFLGIAEAEAVVNIGRRETEVVAD